MPQSPDLSRMWPAAGLRVGAGALELRWMDDELLLSLSDLAARGVHAPDTMPFEHPWTRGTADEVARSVLSYQWRARSNVSAAGFVLELAVVHDGMPVGIQGLVAVDWPVLRRVQTGSWLGLAHQGKGIGRRMRVLALELAFAGLGAAEATSGAFADNPASNAVSQRLGYEPNGSVMVAREGAAQLHHNYRMTRARWESLREEHAKLLDSPVRLQGVAEFLTQITPA